ncbi:hypothetical protein PM082_009651 [Marasmius tenuissimus]|nr:hypothetical protein PM082_009651 [Marasmius tenuissimus]
MVATRSKRSVQAQSEEAAPVTGTEALPPRRSSRSSKPTAKANTQAANQNCQASGSQPSNRAPAAKKQGGQTTREGDVQKEGEGTARTHSSRRKGANPRKIATEDNESGDAHGGIGADEEVDGHEPKSSLSSNGESADIIEPDLLGSPKIGGAHLESSEEVRVRARSRSKSPIHTATSGVPSTRRAKMKFTVNKNVAGLRRGRRDVEDVVLEGAYKSGTTRSSTPPHRTDDGELSGGDNGPELPGSSVPPAFNDKYSPVIMSDDFEVDNKPHEELQSPMNDDVDSFSPELIPTAAAQKGKGKADEDQQERFHCIRVHPNPLTEFALQVIFAAGGELESDESGSDFSADRRAERDLAEKRKRLQEKVDMSRHQRHSSGSDGDDEDVVPVAVARSRRKNKKRKGKGKGKSIEEVDSDLDKGTYPWQSQQAQSSGGPLSAAAEEALDAAKELYRATITSIATKFGVTENACYRYNQDIAVPMPRKPSAWNAFQRSYSQKPGQVERIKEIGNSEWVKHASEVYATRIAQYKHDHPNVDMTDSKVLGKIFEREMDEYWGGIEEFIAHAATQPSFHRYIENIVKQFNMLSRQAYDNWKVHMQGTVINTSLDGYGKTYSCMWGASDTWKKIMENDKAAIHQHVHTLESWFEVTEQKERGKDEKTSTLWTQLKNLSGGDEYKKALATIFKHDTDILFDINDD